MDDHLLNAVNTAIGALVACLITRMLGAARPLLP
jgi:hypothetical protein